MKNKELIRQFANGATSGKASNLYIMDNLLVNYSTAIAKRTEDGVILNAKKYSYTTSKNQNLIRMICNVVKEVDGPNFEA